MSYLILLLYKGIIEGGILVGVKSLEMGRLAILRSQPEHGSVSHESALSAHSSKYS